MREFFENAGEVSRFKNAREHLLLRISLGRVLREEADLPADIDRTRRGFALARQGASKGRFTGTIATNKPHAVAFRDLKVHAAHKHACTHADLEVMNRDHGVLYKLTKEGSTPEGRAQV